MDKIIFTCISCPRGCEIEVTTDSSGQRKIIGNACPKGITYVENEMTCPVRILTTTVPCYDREGISHRLPVRTEKAIPKELIFKALEELKEYCAANPVSLPIAKGDIIMENILNTGENVISCKTYISTNSGSCSSIRI